MSTNTKNIWGISLGLAAGAALTIAAGAFAQESPKVAQGLAQWKDSGCSECHGTFAEGGGGGERPAGPSLRRTRLTPDQLKETIACGRPGSQMPSHLAGAYTKVACYGLPVGEVPRGATAAGTLTAEQIDNIVAYLTARIVGKGAINRAECGAYYGNENDPRCREYR